MAGDPLDVQSALQLAQKVAAGLSGAAPTPAAANDPAPPRSGRPDYDQMFRLKGLAAGEPYLFVRGHDREAGDMARIYAARIARAGAEPALVESALQLADNLDAWPEKRQVNAGHLNETQIKQLRYQLSRRALQASADAEDPRVLLAEERARTEVFNRVAGVLRSLFLGGEQRGEEWVFSEAQLRAQDGRPDAVQRPCPIEQLKAFLESGGRSTHG